MVNSLSNKLKKILSLKMKDIDYEEELEKFYDFEMEIKSIADCRMAIAELNEQEDLLKKIKMKIKMDIKNIKSSYLNERANIRDKYDPNKTLSLMDSLKSPFGSNRYKDMKKLENKRSKDLEYFNELQIIAENLLEQTQDIREEVQKLMKEMLGNF